jgi:aminoglycoside phosphotransferase family enzyme
VSRESRILLTVTFMAGLGVAGLMLVAQQYRKAITTSARRPSGGDEAAIRGIRLVDGYLAARAAVRGKVDRWSPSSPELTADETEAYRVARWTAFDAHGLTYEDYAEVRAAWRTYRKSGVIDDPALAGAFLARRRQLDQADLGPAEALDDAIN